MFGPRMPYWMATMPEAASGIICGSGKGEIGLGPRSSSVWTPSAIIPIPPMAVPTTIPNRSGSAWPASSAPSAFSSPACRSASPLVPTRVLAIHVLGGVEALHLTGDVDLVIGRVEEGDVGDAGTTVDQRVPARLGPDADRRDDAQARDGDAPSTHAAV